MVYTVACLVFLQFFPPTNLEMRLSVSRTHQPVQLAHVRIERLGITMVDTVVLGGMAELRNLPSGTYTIIVDSTDFETSYTDVTLPGDSFVFIDLHSKEPMPVRPPASTKGTSRQFRQFRKLIGVIHRIGGRFLLFVNAQ